ncbi:MAG: PQQ-like beta-propeller repeat protein [Planctomycetaceae bacterium]|nr:PQQ-like beta-propeller repeat protein [Planctomycetaceae bacterium]
MKSVFTLTLLLGSSLLHAADWPHWRGPNRDGTAPHANPPLEWSASKNVKWKVNIPGEGSATPIVWGNRVFTTSAIPTDKLPENPVEPHPEDRTIPPKNIYDFTVFCFDADTGQQLWKQVACSKQPPSGRHKTNTFAAGSPTTDGQRLYVSFGSLGVYCYDLEGNFIWKRDLGTMRTRRGWGEASTPLLQGDSLIVPWDQEDQSKVFVLDAATGKTRWEKKRDEPTGWATPAAVEFNGRTQLILNGTNRVRSYDLKTGELIWQAGGMTVNAIPTPIIHNNVAYVMSGYTGSMALAIPLSAEGDITDSDTILWKHTRSTPYVPSPIIVDDQIYFTASNTSVLTSLDLQTGKPIFGPERIGELGNVYASPVATDDRLYLTGRDGTTVVIEPGKELKILAVNHLGEPVDASPAIVGDRLYLRSASSLFCIEE